MPKNVSILIMFFLLYSLTGSQRITAQEILRIELDASNHSLPFYTIPLEKQGFAVIKGEEIRNRKITTFELLHYDVFFQLITTKTIRSERAGSFAGWEKTDSSLVLLFLEDQPGLQGGFIEYHFFSATIKAARFSFPDINFSDPFFISDSSHVYLTGITIPRRTSLLQRKKSNLVRELFVLSHTVGSDTVDWVSFPAPNTNQLIRAHSNPDGHLMLITRAPDSEKYHERISLNEYHPENKKLIPLSWFPSTMDHYLIDIQPGTFNNHLLALTGTYGSRTKKNWDNHENVPADGFFFGFTDTSLAENDRMKFYPFSRFTNFTSSIRQHYFKNNSSTSRRSAPNDQQGWRMLLHDQLYLYDTGIVMVGEAYYPEYEYESRPQTYYHPYYGYYTGFYDTQSRWVFKGFRYDHAVIAAFDPQGNLAWENSVETSNILDNDLTSRINILKVQNETVLVYAHEGRIWYRVIDGSRTIIDKESYPVELPAPDERVKENFSMNMSPWYDQYFLTWGRQSIRNNSGKNRTVYYCTKLAFE